MFAPHRATLVISALNEKEGVVATIERTPEHLATRQRALLFYLNVQSHRLERPLIATAVRA